MIKKRVKNKIIKVILSGDFNQLGFWYESDFYGVSVPFPVKSPGEPRFCSKIINFSKLHRYLKKYHNIDVSDKTFKKVWLDYIDTLKK